MAKQSMTTLAQIKAIRARYYQALRDGHTKEEAAAIAQTGQPVASTPVVSAPVVSASVAGTTLKGPFFKRGDDLTRIKGIGPGTVKRLSNLGVNSFAQIAAWTPEQVGHYESELEMRGKIVHGNWVEQAQALKAEAFVKDAEV